MARALCSASQPAEDVMQAHVLGLRHELQIFGSVVVLDVIDVVDYLGALQAPAEDAFHYDAMFKTVSSGFDPDQDIASAVMGSSPLPVTVAVSSVAFQTLVATGRGAIDAAPPRDLGSLCGESDATDRAGTRFIAAAPPWVFIAHHRPAAVVAERGAKTALPQLDAVGLHSETLLTGFTDARDGSSCTACRGRILVHRRVTSAGVSPPAGCTARGLQRVNYTRCVLPTRRKGGTQRWRGL